LTTELYLPYLPCKLHLKSKLLVQLEYSEHAAKTETSESSLTKAFLSR
jgi:hypothetical protein